MSSAVDLSAHSGEITSTHQRILNKDPSIDWAVYGFERGSGNVLAVQGQGGAGLPELAEEFDDGKVQFGFARVSDPNTQLPKFVFISWCGRGVPVFRKGMVASQVGEVQQVLTGYHVAVVARSEDDVQPAEIMDQVARSSGAQYSYHSQTARQAPPAPAAKPAFAAGTAFRKGGSYGAPSVTKGPGWSAAAVSAAVSAAATHSSNSASKPVFGGSPASGSPASGRPVSSLFGGARSPTSASAALRASPEPARVAPQVSPGYRSQQDETRAELEALRRGSRAQSPSTSAVSSPPPVSRPMIAPGEPSARVSQADQTKSELEVLRSRKNFGMDSPTTSSGASNAAASERKAELDALRRSRGGSQSSTPVQPAPPVHSWNQQQGDNQKRQQEEEEDRRRQQEEQDRRRQQEEQDRRRQQQEEDNRRRQQDEERRRQQQEEDRKQQEEEERRRQAAPPPPPPPPPAVEASHGGQLARAVYNYEATAEDELEFSEGDTIYNVEQLDPGWWAGETKDGSRRGVFPANFVELIEDAPPKQSAPPALPPAPPAAPALPPAPPAAPPLPPAPPAAPPLPPAPPALPSAPPAAPPLPPAPPAAPSLPQAPPPALPPRGAPQAPPPAPPPPPPAAPALPPRGGNSKAAVVDEGEHQAVAVFDYEAAEEGELSFGDGERITHVEFPSDDWWGGVNARGEYGLFPANYVELVHK